MPTEWSVFYLIKIMHETRDLILSTSFKLFLQKSYKDVTMRELVAKTSLSKGGSTTILQAKRSYS